MRIERLPFHEGFNVKMSSEELMTIKLALCEFRHNVFEQTHLKPSERREISYSMELTIQFLKNLQEQIEEALT